MAAARLYGVGAETLVDFSANIVPWGPPRRVREAIIASLDSIKRYPDPAYGELRSALGRSLGVPGECLAVGNGAADLIYRLVRGLRPKAVVVIDPTFSEYEAAAGAGDIPVRNVPLESGRGFAPDINALSTAVGEGDLVFLCNPNNPTGVLTPRPEVLAAAELAGSRGAWLAVDESFLDFLPDPGAFSVAAAAAAAASPGLVVIGSLTKFYALPGLRLGYLVAEPELARSLRENSAPWTVNVLAERAALAALDDPSYAAYTRRLVAGEREYLSGGLRRLKWLRPWPAAANYVLIQITGTPCPERWPVLTSTELTAALARRGVLVRDGRSFRGLGTGYFRVAVRDRADNARLLAALEALEAVEAVEATEPPGGPAR